MYINIHISKKSNMEYTAFLSDPKYRELIDKDIKYYEIIRDYNNIMYKILDWLQKNKEYQEKIINPKNEEEREFKKFCSNPELMVSNLRDAAYQYEQIRDDVNMLFVNGEMPKDRNFLLAIDRI